MAAWREVVELDGTSVEAAARQAEARLGARMEVLTKQADSR